MSMVLNFYQRLDHMSLDDYFHFLMKIFFQFLLIEYLTSFQIIMRTFILIIHRKANVINIKYE